MARHLFSLRRVGMGILMGLLLSNTALARRMDREGFNFGASLRMMDDEENRRPNSLNDKDVQSSNSNQAVAPYLGYSFGIFNLGLQGYIENRSLSTSEKNPDDNLEIKRQSSKNTRGASLFARFLFANVLYFELGGGAYEETQQVHNEYRVPGDSSNFSGTREDYTVRGAGPGYHVGVGAEFPMAYGFYFTGAYLMRAFQVRELEGGSPGRRQATEQRQELSFGLAYYYQ